MLKNSAEKLIDVMTLRTRLILVFSLLLTAIIAIAWWGSRVLTRQLTDEIDSVAVTVGESLVSVIDERIHNSEPDVDRKPRVTVEVEREIQTASGVVKLWHRQQDGIIKEFNVSRNQGQEHPVELPLAMAEFMSLQVLPRIAADADSTIRFVADNVRQDIPIPSEGVRLAVQDFSKRLTIGLVAFLLFGIAIVALIAHRVSDPLVRLQAAAGKLAKGDLGAKVESNGVPEVQATIRSFNQMSQQLSELEKSRQQLQATQHLSEIGDIGRGLAHSLRNPLNAIGLAVDNLSARIGNDEQAKDISRETRRQIRRIDESIRSFLTLAQQEHAAAASVDVTNIARDVALELTQSDNADIDIRNGQGNQILGLEAEIRTMLQALIVNAVEAQRETGSTEPVTVEFQKNESQLQVSISDRGPGITPTVREQLFQPHATSKADGAGMGLYLTRRIARHRYDGDIELHDRDGGGITAELMLSNRIESSQHSSVKGSP